MEKANTILKDIKNRGYRYSETREAMLDFIIKSNKPLSYFDLQTFFKKRGLPPNKTTVYRELAFLKQQNIINELQFNDGIKYYEIATPWHHHHIICNECEAIDHIELEKDLEMQEKSIFKNNKFKVLTHSLEFYGICNSCVKNKN